MRGGPSGSGRLPEGAKLVTPASSKNAGERARSMMTPSRPAGGRLLAEPLGIAFFKEALAELRKVNWPTRMQARNLTILVIAVSICVGLVLGAMDYVYESIFELVLGLGG